MNRRSCLHPRILFVRPNLLKEDLVKSFLCQRFLSVTLKHVFLEDDVGSILERL